LDAVFISDSYICIKNEDFPGGVIFQMPMHWDHRQKEKNDYFVDYVTKVCGYKNYIDLSYFEKEGKAFEGRGCVMFDWIGKVVYAGESNRVHEECFKTFIEQMNSLN
jgi:hypothetical protein